jgi:hypothetical protein
MHGPFEGTGCALFEQKQIRPMNFSLATWSNRTSRSTVVKSGSAADHEKLSEASNCNKVRPNKMQKKKTFYDPLCPACQKRRIEKQQEGRTQSHNDDGGEADAFADAFGDMQLLRVDMTERDQEFKEQTDRETKDGRHEPQRLAKQQVTEWQWMAVDHLCTPQLVGDAIVETTPALEGCCMEGF